MSNLATCHIPIALNIVFNSLKRFRDTKIHRKRILQGFYTKFLFFQMNFTPLKFAEELFLTTCSTRLMQFIQLAASFVFVFS